jgi:anti-sigma factor RsiW
LLQLRDAHEQAQMLLPWHVNGSLEPGEAALVEAHLAECAECRATLPPTRRCAALSRRFV